MQWRRQGPSLGRQMSATTVLLLIVGLVALVVGAEGLVLSLIHI